MGTHYRRETPLNGVQSIVIAMTHPQAQSVRGTLYAMKTDAPHGSRHVSDITVEIDEDDETYNTTTVIEYTVRFDGPHDGRACAAVSQRLTRCGVSLRESTPSKVVGYEFVDE